jgi:hypothetical protein
MMKVFALIASLSVMLLIAVSCGQGSSEVEVGPTQPLKTLSVGSSSGPTPNSVEGISSSEIALLVPFSDWHNRWSETTLQFEKEELVTELSEIFSSIEYQLDEPLVSIVDLYLLAHSLVNEIKTTHALRAATFSVHEELANMEMTGPCDLPDASSVPAILEQELMLLELQCFSITIAEQFLSEWRIFAEKTWLNPKSPTVILETSVSEASLVSLLFDWHQRWNLAPSLSDEEGLIKQLDTLNASMKGKLNEPLASAVEVYSLAHMVSFLMSEQLIYRGVQLLVDANLESNSMDDFCANLEAQIIPQELQPDAALLVIDCIETDLAKAFVEYYRYVAEETWLKP